MRRTCPRRIAALVALAVLLAWPRHGLADEVALRAFARLDAPGPVRVADVADLQGPEAERLGQTIIAEKAADASRVGTDDVRRALERAGANMGRLRVSGASCLVRIGNAPAPAEPREPAQPATPNPASSDAPGTIRAHISHRLGDLLGVEEADLRLTFDDADAGLLNTAVGARTLVVQPQGTGDRMPLSVRVYDGDRLAAGGTVRVGVLVRRDVLVAAASLDKGDTLTTDAVTRDEQWLPPSVTPANPATAMRQVVRGRVPAGKVLLAGDVELPVMVKKGDLVTVDCVSGGFVVTGAGRATEPGREGQVISLQAVKSRHTFRARITGPGRAVTVAGDAPAGN